jgi:DNA-directed RNA polymerase specialized sigma24 family protein
VTSESRPCDFTRFAAEHRLMAERYVDRLLDGTSHNEVDRDGVVQEAFTRAWTSWATWPTELGPRRAYLKRTLRVCGVDALRKARGRGTGAAAAVPTSFTDLEGDTDDARIAAAAQAALLPRALDKEELVDERLLTVSLMDVLTDLERKAIALSAAGRSDTDVADALGVTHQHVRTVLMEGRALLRSLVAHADVLEADDTTWPLAGTPTSKRTRRLLRRHIDACAVCRATDTDRTRVLPGSTTPLRPSSPDTRSTTALHSRRITFTTTSRHGDRLA